MPPNRDQTKINREILEAIKVLDGILTADNKLLAVLTERLEFLLSREYLSEFEVIDRLNQHRNGLTFEQWKEGHCVR